MIVTDVPDFRKSLLGPPYPQMNRGGIRRLFHEEGFDRLYSVRIAAEDERPPSCASTPRFIVTHIPKDSV
jgi:hypothetical protein